MKEILLAKAPVNIFQKCLQPNFFGQYCLRKPRKQLLESMLNCDEFFATQNVKYVGIGKLDLFWLICLSQKSLFFINNATFKQSIFNCDITMMLPTFL